MKIDKGKYNILVVEDNPGDFFLVQEYLSEQIQLPALYHMKSIQATHEFLENNPTKLDIILLDLSLPDISTEKLIEEAERFNITTPVIILTGYTDLELAVKSLSVGISDYLLKDILTPLALYKSIIYAIERQRFMRSLRESEKKYIDIFHLSPEPMWVYNRDSYRFMDANNAAMNHYGYSKEEFLAMTIFDIRPKEDVEKLKEAIEHTKENNILSFKFPNAFRHLKKNGDIIMVEISRSSIEFNNVNAVIVAARDISEKMMYLEAIESQNKRLREIAWTQSHTFRAPVARLIGIIELLEDKTLDDYDKELLLQSISDSAKEIDVIIKDIVIKSNEVFQSDKSKQ